MGGRGHLSNEQCAAAVSEIRPRSHVVLLHLSRECNHPSLAARVHDGAPYALTLSHHQQPTPWVPIRAVPQSRPAMQVQLGFSWPAVVPGAAPA